MASAGDEYESAVSSAVSSLQKLQRRQRELYTSGESSAGISARAGEAARAPPAAAPESAAGGVVSRDEFAKFQDAFAKVNEMNERIISQNVLLQAELEALARSNADLRAEKAALAARIKRSAHPA